MAPSNRIDCINNASISFNFDFKMEDDQPILTIYKNALKNESWKVKWDQLPQLRADKTVPSKLRELKIWLNRSNHMPVLKSGIISFLDKRDHPTLFLELLSRLPYETASELMKSAIATSQYNDDVVTCQYDDGCYLFPAGYYIFLKNHADNTISVKIYEKSGVVKDLRVNSSYKELLTSFSPIYSAEETLKVILQFQNWFTPQIEKGELLFEKNRGSFSVVGNRNALSEVVNIKDNTPDAKFALIFTERAIDSKSSSRRKLHLDVKIEKIDLSEEIIDWVKNIEPTLTANTKIALALLNNYLDYEKIASEPSLSCWNSDQSLADSLLNKIYRLVLQEKVDSIIVVLLLERYEDLIEKLALAAYPNKKLESSRKELWDSQIKKLELISPIHECHFLVKTKVKQIVNFLGNIKNSEVTQFRSWIKSCLSEDSISFSFLRTLIKFNRYLLNSVRAILYCNRAINKLKNSRLELKSKKDRELELELLIQNSYFVLGEIFSHEIGDYQQASLLYSSVHKNIKRIEKSVIGRKESCIDKVKLKELKNGLLLNFSQTCIFMQKFDQSDELLKDLDELQNEDIYDIVLGNLCVEKGDYKKAIDSYEKFLKSTKEKNYNTISTRRLLASVYRRVFQFDKAIGLLRSSLSETESLPIKERAILKEMIYNELALTQLQRNDQELEDLANAEENFLKAKRISDQYDLKEARARVCTNLANVYIKKRKFEKAEKYALLGKEIEEEIGKETQGAVYNSLGILYTAQEDFSKAFAYFKQRNDFANLTGNQYLAAQSHHNMGYALFRDGKLEAAKEQLQQAIALHSRVRSSGNFNFSEGVTFLKGLSISCAFLEHLLHELSQSDEAFVYTDFRKARALVEKLIQKEPKIEPKIGMNQVTVSQTQALAQRLCATIVVYSYPNLEDEAWCWVIPPSGDIAKARKLNLSAICQSEELEFKSNRPSYLRNALHDSTLERGHRWEESLPDFIKFFAGKSRDRGGACYASEKEKELARLWYDSLIKPIEGLLPETVPETEGAPRVAFIPDSIIHQLPFAIFLDKNEKYLIEKYTLFSAPSIATLLALEELQELEEKGGKEAPQNFCVFSDTDPENPLPGALDEGKKLAASQKSEHFFQHRATFQNFCEVAKNAKYIHIASHGRSTDDENEPLKKSPYSVFQGALDFHDREVFGDDIVSLPLKADFAVLSACQSGKGYLCPEGIVGLAHAFLGAGASSVIATRWNVPDDQTPLLTHKFYEFYLNGQGKQGLFTQVEALRLAMLATKERFPGRMKLWGAFFLQGLPIKLKTKI